MTKFYLGGPYRCLGCFQIDASVDEQILMCRHCVHRQNTIQPDKTACANESCLREDELLYQRPNLTPLSYDHEDHETPATHESSAPSWLEVIRSIASLTINRLY